MHPLGGEEIRVLRRVKREAGESSRYVFVTERNGPMTAAGFRKTVEATLVLGPPLRLATTSKIADNTVSPKAVSKPGGPDRVSVIATPLGDGKMKVTIEYYVEGRIQTVPCEGQPAEIDAQAAKKLPPRELEAARAALDRIRSLTDPKPPDKKQ